MVFLWSSHNVAKLFSQVSSKSLRKAIAEGAFDDATIRGLLEVAEEEEKVSVRLLKKRGEEEWWRVSSSYSDGSNSQVVVNSRKGRDFRLSGFLAESSKDTWRYGAPRYHSSPSGSASHPAQREGNSQIFKCQGLTPFPPYAKAHGISKITGSEFVLRITEQTDLQFPGPREEGRENLEEYLKKSGLWEQALALDLKRLKKAIADGAFDDATIRALLEFAEEEEKVSVRLRKKREEEEWWRGGRETLRHSNARGWARFLPGLSGKG
jgi:hypothetical protein